MHTPVALKRVSLILIPPFRFPFGQKDESWDVIPPSDRLRENLNKFGTFHRG